MRPVDRLGVWRCGTSRRDAGAGRRGVGGAADTLHLSLELEQRETKALPTAHSTMTMSATDAGGDDQLGLG